MKSQIAASSVQEKIGLQIVPLTLIIVGGLFFVFAALLIVDQYLPSNDLAITPLKVGTYVPAQVVFKLKPGQSADTVISQALSTPQTLYRTSDNKLLPSYDPAVKTAQTALPKVSLKLTKKSVRRVFPDVNVSQAAKDKILRRGGKDPSTTFQEMGMDRWYVAEVNESQADVATLVVTIKSQGNAVESVVANGLSRPSSVLQENPPLSGGGGTPTPTGGCSNPNDPYSCRVGTVSASVPDQFGLTAMNVRTAWNTSKGNNQTVIAVIDSGVDYTHPELQGRVWVNSSEDINHNGCADYWSKFDVTAHTDCLGRAVITGGDLDGWDNDNNWYADDLNGYDFSSEAGNNNVNGPFDMWNHGTLVAGAAVAVADNAIGTAGVCPMCTVMPLEINSASTKASAFYYAANMGADIITFSWNCMESGSQSCSSFDAAVHYAISLAIPITAAAGNVDSPILSTLHPQYTDPEVIVVGDAKYDSSVPTIHAQRNRFSGLGSSFGDQVDVMAIGGQGVYLNPKKITGTIDPGLLDPDTIPGDQNYQKINSVSTSFATPQVAGVVGLMKSVNPSLSAVAIQDIIQNTAIDMISVLDESNHLQQLPGKDVYTGYGLTNAAAAVQEAKNRQPDFAVTADVSAPEAVASNQLRPNVHIENYGRTTANNVLYRILNADNGAVVYEGRIDSVSAWAGRSLWSAVTITGTMPSRIKFVIDPTNEFPELFENNNTSAAFGVLAYGTPIITPIASTTTKTGQTTSFTISATDPNDAAETLVYTANNLPPGSTFIEHVFSWTPDASASGAYTPTFSVTDPHGLTNTLAVRIDVQGPIPVGYSSQYDNCNHQIPTSIPAGQTVWRRLCQPVGTTGPYSYSVSNLPSSASLSSDILIWHPGTTDVGKSLSATVNITDGKGATTTYPVNATIAATDNRPNLDFPASDSPYDYFVWKQPSTDVARVHVRIKNLGGSNAPATKFQISCSEKGSNPVNSGNIPALTKGQEFVLDQPLYAPCQGVGHIYFVVNYNYASFSEYPWGSTGISNVLPIPITSPTLTFDSLANQSVERGTNLTFTVHAKDTLGLPLTYTTGTLPFGATFNATTQTFSWTPGATSNPSAVTFYASNGVVQTAQTIGISLGGRAIDCYGCKNDPPGGNPGA